MPIRTFVAILCALPALPGAAVAGPISFTLAAGNLSASGDAPQLGLALVPAAGGAHTAELHGTQPLTLGVIGYEPGRIPLPAPRDVHADGTTHWNNDGYFAVDVTLTDSASGEAATLTMRGRAHMYSGYTAAGGWTGTTYFWFQDRHELTLGGNRYTVRGANPYTAGAAAVDVWVGNGAPVYTPEPGTLVLAALGLAPLALRRLRRTPA